MVRIKDRFVKPQPSGYRDILLNIEMSNGHIVEMQLHLKSILRAKKEETELYNRIRSIEALAKKEGRKLTLKEEDIIQELRNKSKELYQKALNESK